MNHIAHIPCLITGGKGQLALALQAHPLASSFQITALSHQQLDISNPDQLANAFKHYQPKLVINTAAYTAVDQAETERRAALASNVTATETLAKACAAHHLPLIHFSTDYVFDGQQQTPYHEQVAPNPLSYYGQTKWQSELAVRSQLTHHIILRISGVFSANGQNFVKAILNAAKTRERLEVVADQITCPTSADDIAGAVWHICQAIATHGLKAPSQFPWGTYHYCSQPATSWHHFAEQLCHQANKLTELTVRTVAAIDTETLKRPAPRPAYAVFDCSKIKHTFAIEQPHWQIGLIKVLKQLLITEELPR